MKATIVLTSLFAALAMSSPVSIEERQASTRVLLARDSQDVAAQRDIPRDNVKRPIRNFFGNLGNPIRANRAGVVSGAGSCRIWSDAQATRLVATIRAGGGDVTFGEVLLQDGVLACQG